jgi:hypothetical protein
MRVYRGGGGGGRRRGDKGLKAGAAASLLDRRREALWCRRREDGGWCIGWGRHCDCGRGGVGRSQGLYPLRNLSDGRGVRGRT